MRTLLQLTRRLVRSAARRVAVRKATVMMARPVAVREATVVARPAVATREASKASARVRIGRSYRWGDGENQNWSRHFSICPNTILDMP